MPYLSKTFDGRLELLETYLGRIHVKVKNIFEKSERVTLFLYTYLKLL